MIVNVGWITTTLDVLWVATQHTFIYFSRPNTSLVKFLAQISSANLSNPIEQTSFPRARFRNRGFLAILNKILVNSRFPNTRTHLMYRTNLSFALMKLYLESAVSLGLLSETWDNDGVRRLYETTERGVKFIEAYGSLVELVPLVGEIDDF
jgi:predicted transcriptional regulator